MDRRTYWRGSGVRRESRPGGLSSTRALEVQKDREAARGRPAGGGLQWKRMDLHLHTPSSSDYRDPGISYLDILKKAENKGLDMIAFADHNTVAGYAAMHKEIETLTLLEKLNRLTDQERTTLNEYRRLLDKIVVLPAFEFTATFGFHILGIFPENTSVRKLEHLLLDLNVPEEKMLAGAPDAGSTSDVLTAYQMITAAGGLAIAAHANSSNGVAMQGFPFGGQTKIAYTQDPNLAALEVTDLDSLSRRSTAFFFDGSKTEYVRRMHCIQGSDAHSLETEQSDAMNKRLGVGARITEILITEASFAALKEVLTGNDFTRTRPYRANLPWEEIESLRAAGPTQARSFHERAVTHTSRTRPILHDVIAFANTEGGTIYVGANPETRVPMHGLEHPDEDVRLLKEEIRRTIEPQIEVEYEVRRNGDRGIVLITVPRGANTPYTFAPTCQVYIREGASTILAGREDIVRLVLNSTLARQAPAQGQARPKIEAVSPPQPRPEPTLPPRQETTRPPDKARTAERVLPPAILSKLPPEKIKGKIQPMFQQATSASGEGANQAQAQPELQETAPAGQAQPEQAAQQAPAEQPVSRGRGRPRGKKAATEPAQETSGGNERQEAVPEKEKPARGRPRRKTSQKAEEAAVLAEARASGPTAQPMQTTVAAEHDTREEIVAEAEAKPKRGRRKATAKKELEVEAPAAAASATQAAAEAVLAGAEVEPGAQIPGEAGPAPDATPMTSPPQKKARSRRKTAAQKAAEAEAEAPEKAKAPPAGGKSATKGRSTKKEERAIEPPDPPRTGVEIISTEARGNTNYHTMRDLRNESIVHNVTMRSARRLWHYAIVQHEHGDPELAEILWHPSLPIGMWRRDNRAGAMRYDLVSRYPDGSMRIFYGVTEDGLQGPWLDLLALADEVGYEGPEAKE